MTASFAVGATLTRADIPALCASLATLLREHPRQLVVCDVAVARPDVVTAEAVARLRLTARRHGSRLVVSGAGPDLVGLLSLLGLSPGDP